MTPAKRFIELAEKTGLFDRISAGGALAIVCHMEFKHGDRLSGVSVMASVREIDLFRGDIEILFMQRLENALRVAVAHKDETGVTEADMKRMLKDARESIAETPESA